MSTSVKSDIKAFNMFGNLYFVGSSKVCVHIIKTEQGLVMIDTGFNRAGLHRLAQEHVDLQMGNHAGHNDTKGKCKRVLNGESIINPDEWQQFLAEMEKILDDVLEKEKAELNS